MRITPLCELAKKHGTDKGGEHFSAGDTCHAYTPAYYDLFHARRDTVKRVLEIGVHYGPSLRMWRDYFPNAQIVGLDSNAAALFQEDRIRCFAADQGNAPSLMQAIAAAGPGDYDLIVDDGSHELHHQILSANVLMPYLAPDGVYVIEDIHMDCKPETVTDFLSPQYKHSTVRCEGGLGKAHCGCGCGAKYETLILIRH